MKSSVNAKRKCMSLSVRSRRPGSALPDLWTRAVLRMKGIFSSEPRFSSNASKSSMKSTRFRWSPRPAVLLFDMRAEEDAAYEAAAGELAEAEQRLIEVRHETGRVDERIAMMERSEERSRALVKQERVLARLDAAAEHWAVLTLCRAMLDETRASMKPSASRRFSGRRPSSFPP